MLRGGHHYEQLSQRCYSAQHGTQLYNSIQKSGRWDHVIQCMLWTTETQERTACFNIRHQVAATCTHLVKFQWVYWKQARAMHLRSVQVCVCIAYIRGGHRVVQRMPAIVLGRIDLIPLGERPDTSTLKKQYANNKDLHWAELHEKIGLVVKLICTSSVLSDRGVAWISTGKSLQCILWGS